MGRADVQRGRVNLSEVARVVFEELRERDPDRAVELRVEEKLSVDADRRLMRVLFDNLIGNAWKFTSKTSAPCITVGSEPRDGSTVYFVRDNGAGFDMAYAEKLFTPFQRLHSAADFPGTGVGLATVHRVVDRHGGKIWAEGAVGSGAAFYFTLPPSASAFLRAHLAPPTARTRYLWANPKRTRSGAERTTLPAMTTCQRTPIPWSRRSATPRGKVRTSSPVVMTSGQK